MASTSKIVAMEMLKLSVFPEDDVASETIWRQMLPSVQKAWLVRSSEFLKALEGRGYVVKHVEEVSIDETEERTPQAVEELRPQDEERTG